MADNMASRTPDIPYDGTKTSSRDSVGAIRYGNFCAQPGANDFWDGANCDDGEYDSTGRDID